MERVRARTGWLLLLPLMFIAGCGGSGGGSVDPVDSSDAGADHYYPLTIGARWSYDVYFGDHPDSTFYYSYSFTRTVTDSVTYHGHSAWVSVDTIGELSEGHVTTCLRSNEGGWHLKTPDKPAPVDDGDYGLWWEARFLQADSLGKTWTDPLYYPLDNEWTLLHANAAVALADSRYFNCLELVWVLDDAGDRTEVHEYYATHIGLVRREWKQRVNGVWGDYIRMDLAEFDPGGGEDG